MYDEITDLYHLVYKDWETAIEQQAAALDCVFVDLIGPPPHSLLDVSCGIGTQALGLANLKYNVTGSDLSARAVARARSEASCRGLDIQFCVADMREYAHSQIGAFDILLTADNSIPHLAGVPEVSRALRGFYERLRPGGVALVGIRDYEAEADRTSPQVLPYGFREHNGHRYFVFQTRDWRDTSYQVGLYFVREAKGDQPAEVIAGVSQYFIIQVDKLLALFADAGFVSIRRLDGVMHQPIVVGRRPEQ